MSYRLRFTPEAKQDLEPLHTYLAENDPVSARRALQTIGKAWEMLEEFPFSCRRAEGADALLRELIISFGRSGYVALFEISDADTVTILAFRHQRENDYLGTGF